MGEQRLMQEIFFVGQISAVRTGDSADVTVYAVLPLPHLELFRTWGGGGCCCRCGGGGGSGGGGGGGGLWTS